MPPPGILPGAGVSSLGNSHTAQSVINSRPATEAAFCSAVRVTLVGSTTPACIRSPYSRPHDARESARRRRLAQCLLQPPRALHAERLRRAPFSLSLRLLSPRRLYSPQRRRPVSQRAPAAFHGHSRKSPPRSARGFV